MEVHHHAHSSPDAYQGHKRKWTHYFWEFLMLFLAVTLGFFVENQREHLIEHRREKQFMFSLKEDLLQDIMYWDVGIATWQKIYYNIDTLRNYMELPYDPDHSKRIYHFARRMDAFVIFIYNDKTIEQLRNAGNFRLLRKQVVVNNLNAYDNIITDQFRKLEEDARTMKQSIGSIQSDLFVFAKSNSFTESSSFPIANKPDLLSRYNNELWRYQRIADHLVSLNKFLKKKAEELVKIVETEYHLK